MTTAESILGSVAFIKVKQKVELLEAITGFETNNKYEVQDGSGKVILKAKEHTGCCARVCLAADRPFMINIEDAMTGQELIRVQRKYKCLYFGDWCACSNCCKDTVTIEAPPGNVVGYVRQICSPCSAKFYIEGPDAEPQLRLHGPCYCACRCPGQKYKFQLLGLDGETEVGKIYKEWAGFAKELLTDADNFTVEFPPDMHVNTKCTMLGAVFLIDFMFFENSGGKNQIHPI